MKEEFSLKKIAILCIICVLFLIGCNTNEEVINSNNTIKAKVDLNRYSNVLVEKYGGTLEKDLANVLKLPLNDVQAESNSRIIGDNAVSINWSTENGEYTVMQHKSIENFYVYGVKIGMESEMAENILLNQITKKEDNNYYITDKKILNLNIENNMVTEISFTNRFADEVESSENEEDTIKQNNIIGKWILEKINYESGNTISKENVLSQKINVDFYSDGIAKDSENMDYILQGKKIQILSNEETLQEQTLGQKEVVREYDYITIDDKAILRRKVSVDGKETEYYFYYKEEPSDAKYFFVDGVFVGAYENNCWNSAMPNGGIDWQKEPNIPLKNIFNVDGYNIYNLTEKVGKTNKVEECGWALAWTLAESEEFEFTMPFLSSQVTDDAKAKSDVTVCRFDLNGSFATNAEHDVLIKKSEIIDEDAEIFDVLVELFKENNIPKEKINIEKIIELDFNNDGKSERLAVANTLVDDRGQDIYSIVIMFNEDGTYEILKSEFGSEVSWYDGSFAYDFEGVYDFEGDEEYEICIKEYGYEWFYVRVFKKINGVWGEILTGYWPHNVW